MLNFLLFNGIIFFVSIEEGLRVQALSRPQRVRKHATEPDLSRLETASNASSENTPLKRPKTLSDDSSAENSLAEAVTDSVAPPELPQPVGDIELIFRPLPAEHESPDDSQIRYIKTTANATGTADFSINMIHDFSDILTANDFSDILTANNICCQCVINITAMLQINAMLFY